MSSVAQEAAFGSYLGSGMRFITFNIKPAFETVKYSL